ncbi:MAG: DEAD/DEAH box helicase [Treponema sp.]|jgi:superfamily II DNA/RNA helicase|nr:DEAD/DEAH box helicase [Treponema sp.]
MESFAALGIHPFLAAKLARRHILEPTEIQRRVIPPLLEGRGVLFQSATGTGKTFAYLLPLLQILLESGPGEAAPRGPALLIAAPTHELCSQIKAEADFLLEGSPLKAALLIGSVSPARQIETLKKTRPAAAVGNPARLLMLARLGKLKLEGLRFLVLDEGDRLTADELLANTRDLALLAGSRRKDLLTAACSATIGRKSRERLLPLMGEGCLTIRAGGEELYRNFIEHWAIFSEGRRKIRTLRSFISAARPGKALVFTGRPGDAGNITAQLQHHRIAAAGLYGDLDKRKRRAALDDFRAGRVRVLVSSDLAARGLDIPGVTHVIALDVPAGEEAYLHRAGRTGRAGRRGVMVTIGDAEELPRLAAIEKRLGIAVYPKELYGGSLRAPAAWDGPRDPRQRQT